MSKKKRFKQEDDVNHTLYTPGETQISTEITPLLPLEEHIPVKTLEQTSTIEKTELEPITFTWKQLKAPSYIPDPNTPPELWELMRYKWQTVHGGQAHVLCSTIEKTKEKFRFDGDNESFIKKIQDKIDMLATLNPRWTMQQVFEELGR